MLLLLLLASVRLCLQVPSNDKSLSRRSSTHVVDSCSVAVDTSAQSLNCCGSTEHCGKSAPFQPTNSGPKIQIAMKAGSKKQKQKNTGQAPQIRSFSPFSPGQKGAWLLGSWLPGPAGAPPQRLSEPAPCDPFQKLRI